MRNKHLFMLLAFFLAVSLVFIVSSCSDDNNDNPASSTGGNNGGNQDPNTVEISSFTFNPGTISVSIGTTITWINRDATAHTVTSDDGSFTSSGNLGQDETYQVTFSTLGDYPYHCSIHPAMTATVTVTP